VTRWPSALRDQRGVALLMVLWLFMVLTVLVGEFSRSMRDDALATENLAEENQARGVAVAGINRALYAALRAREQNPQDPDDADDEEEREIDELAPQELEPDGTWHEGTYSGGNYAVRIVDEGGKIGLNRADESLLRRVFANLGLDTDAQEEVVDAILDWRDPDSLHRLHGAEADYYLGLPEPYVPKDGPFDSVEELLTVRGITRELFFGVPDQGLERDAKPAIPLKEIFSVFNRSANISVRNAPPAVLRLLLNGEEEDVEEVLDARANDPASALSLIRSKVGDPLLARRLVSTAPRTVSIDARAMMQDGRIEARVGAVVDLAEDGEGFHVARWIDRLPAL
jgi:general secretion pathway protein K